MLYSVLFRFGHIRRWDQCAVYILYSKISTDPGLLKIRHSHRFIAVVIQFLIPLDRTFKGWIKICRREQDSLILTEGIRDIFKTNGRMRDDTREITRYGRYTENYVSNQVRWRD